MRRYLLLLLLIISTVASAKTYYVATNGSDLNNGTSLSTPFATWQRGFTLVNAGDTLFIRGGVYNLSGLGVSVEGRYSGTKDNPICIFAYPPDWDQGNKPILDCSGVVPRYATDFAAISFYEVQYIHLKGLTVRNLYQRYRGEYMPEAFSAVACANFTFENCTAQNISGRGFWYHSGHWNTWDGPGALFEYDTTRWINCDAFDLRDSLSVNPGNAADGWKCHTYQGCVYMLEGCRAWNYSDDGFDISGEGHRIFKNCWAMSSEKYASMDIEGNGFKCTGRNPAYSRFEYLTDTILVRYVNCLAAYCHGSGFANNLQVDGVNYINNNGLIINNTSYHNAVGFWEEGNANTRVPNSPTYKNNIAINSTHYEYGTYLYQVFICNPPIYNASHNNWIPDPNSDWPGWIYNPAFTVKDDDFVSIDSSQIHAARKKDGSLPDITFLKLTPGSDLIDAGVNVGLPYFGSAPDVGYSEYNSGSVVIPVPEYVTSVIENATPARLEMTYNLTLANIVPATSAFTVKVNNVTRSVSSVAISGTKVLLTLASPVVYGDAVTVAYTKPSTNPLQTVAGGQAESISARNVTNNVTAVIPVYVNSVIENVTPARLEMTYNLTLANIIPTVSAFTVKVNNVTRSVSSVAISGTKVLLTLASPVVYGDAVTVAYTKPSTNPLQTVAGGQAESITNKSVINNCSNTANQPPVITITSPTKNTAFISPATITIEATASDPDGSVSKVEFFSGTTKLVELSVPPFVFTLKDVQEGRYTFSAIATDNLNAKAVSAAVDIVVEKSTTTTNQLPIVAISFVSTGNPKKPKKHDNIILKAEASDPDGTISKVEFKNGNATLAEISTPPYEFTLKDIDTGTYIIYAIATDNLSASNTSSSIEFIVTDWDKISPDVIDLYPNPNNGQFAIKFKEPLPSGDSYVITIVSLSGESVFKDMVSDQEQYKEIYLEDAAAGTYVLIITGKNKIFAAEKFLVK